MSCPPGIIDFMYYGEVAVPTQDISRFLAVAEQFQVRGLVEDVPMVRVMSHDIMMLTQHYFLHQLGAVSSSRQQSKRPRMVRDEHDSHVEEAGERYQPLGEL